jgi:hypothetical protein
LFEQDLHGFTVPVLVEWGLFARIREERHLSRVLDGFAEVGLVLRARAGHPAGPYLPALGEETPQHAHVLVVDVVDLFLAEVTDLALLLSRIRRLLLFACYD